MVSSSPPNYLKRMKMEVPEQSSQPVRLVVKSDFDHQELWKQPFGSREEAEGFVATQSEEGVVYEIEDAG